MISISKSYIALKLNFRVFFLLSVLTQYCYLWRINLYSSLNRANYINNSLDLISLLKSYWYHSWNHTDITLEIILISLLKSYWYHYNIAITDDNIILTRMNHLMRITQITRLKYSRILYTFPSAPQMFGHIRIYTPRILIRKAFPKC